MSAPLPPPDPQTPGIVNTYAAITGMYVCCDQTGEYVQTADYRTLERDLSLASAKLEQMEKALKEATADMQWAVMTIQAVADPKSQQKIVWKDVCMTIYAGMNRIAEYRAALASSLNTEKKT